MNRGLWFATLLLLSVGGADAQMMRGAGAESCGQWMSYMFGVERQVEVNWVLGFLSAANILGSEGHDFLKGTDDGAVSVWMDNYCRQHPLDQIAGAANKLR